MPIIDARDILSFQGGDNATDTVIGGIHFNLTTLDHFNYTLYSNGTLSNRSKCFLTFEPHTPKLLYQNGTFINTTSCYSPVNEIGTRSKIGIAFACMFGVLLVLNLVCVSKHGSMFLPAEKRFWPIGRRWQWYWGCLTCAMALVSLFTNVDVDRYYLTELPIVLTSFFWYLLEMCTMGVVWEALRHWGSWMERQYIDPNPFVLPESEWRYNFELLIPIVFYFFVWMNFFMVVPRSWGHIELQRSPEQTAQYASPDATDARFKVGSFFLVAAWCVMIVSLRHSIRNYMPRNRGFFNQAAGVISSTPLRFLLLLPLCLGMIAYQILCSFKFEYSVLNAKGNHVAIYVGGYLPTLLILIIQVLYGWISPNEDRELIRQRRVRGQEMDRELGLVHKPAWWRPANFNESMRDRIARNVGEIGGNRKLLNENAQNAGGVELDPFSDRPRRGSLTSIRTSASGAPSFSAYGGKSDRRRHERTMQVVASMLFPSAEPAIDRRAELMMDGPPPPYPDGSRAGRSSNLTRSNSTNTMNSVSAEPQKVRSMLDL
ncbi:hypothetical protein CMQ_1674 [Grosmannia clavigera kw1407]|uniref:Uncharacterized protein n=1 Tax=Grosmannia clavigera (strain kw1407 / UAMH 11150) TaxID=655863 RepID=F0XFE7_GROCL|nr:uncharacterized protein CMQ_1674 [Grosmannia clavigera kw1407]EFX04746.1 hypothetical protein CMQ_1674 [Grosmannia clavigera kw1407]